MMENDIKLGAEVDNNQERDNKKLELKIDGISCQACVAKIERKLSKTDGVEKALVIFQIIWQILNIMKKK